MEQQQFISQIVALRSDFTRKALAMYEGDNDRAEDAVSELLLKLWEQREALDEIRSLPAYCHTLLRNLILDDLRRQRLVPLEAEVTEEESTLHSGQQYELRDLLAQAIKQLPTLRQQVYTLHDMEGYSADDIAQLLGLRTSAVHNHLSRARKQLRDYLAPRL